MYRALSADWSNADGTGVGAAVGYGVEVGSGFGIGVLLGAGMSKPSAGSKFDGRLHPISNAKMTDPRKNNTDLFLRL
jgi:hypothetical protein